MKKLLFFVLLLLIAGVRNAHAGSAKVQIINNTDYNVHVKMYGYALTTCPSGPCDGTYVTSTITIPTAWGLPGTPNGWGPYTPCAISSGVGWTTDLCGPTNWCSLPLDFTWTLAEIDIPLAGGWGTFPVYLSPGQLFCSGWLSTAGPYYSGGWTMDFTWFGAAGPWEDAVIYIHQY
jgi:hypothetical protein